MTEQATPDGKNKLFNDSKLGVIMTGGATLAIDAVLTGAVDALTNIDTSGWSGWWTTVASAVLATVLGAVTAYKAKREKKRLAGGF